MKKVQNMIEKFQDFLLKPRKPSEKLVNKPFFYYLKLIWDIFATWFLCYVLMVGCVTLPSIWMSLETFNHQSKDMVLTAKQLHDSSVILNCFLAILWIFLVILTIAINPEKGLYRFFGKGRWHRKRYLSEISNLQITRNVTEKTNSIIYTPSESEKSWMDNENIDAYQVIIKEDDKELKISLER